MTIDKTTEKKADVLDQRGATVYTKSSVVLEGKLKVQMQKFFPPISCKHDCEMGSFLSGVVEREHGITTLYHLDKILEKLNGKEIKLTIEWV